MNETPDSAAKMRFIALSLFRVVGALMVMAGFALISGGFTVSGPPNDRWLGTALVLLGVFEFAVMPLILARRWRTPRA
jgi:hypothetical protein